MYVEFDFKSTCSHYIGVDLKEVGEEDETLIVVTADHGHGFVCCCPVTSQASMLTQYLHRMSLVEPILNISQLKILTEPREGLVSVL